MLEWLELYSFPKKLNFYKTHQMTWNNLASIKHLLIILRRRFTQITIKMRLWTNKLVVHFWTRLSQHTKLNNFIAFSQLIPCKKQLDFKVHNWTSLPWWQTNLKCKSIYQSMWNIWVTPAPYKILTVMEHLKTSSLLRVVKIWTHSKITINKIRWVFNKE